MVKEQLKDELGISVDGLQKIARFMLTGNVPSNIDSDAALTASTTFYTILGYVPKGATLISGQYRVGAVSVAGSTLNIYKVPSGTAITAGTALVTQVDLTVVGAVNTNTALTVTAANKAVDEGSLIVAKVITGVGETVKGIVPQLEFAL